MTGRAAQNARTSADRGDRGSGDGAAERGSTHLQAFRRMMGQYGGAPTREMLGLGQSKQQQNHAAPSGRPQKA